MGLYKKCSKCGNERIISHKVDTKGKVLCLNCVIDFEASDFKKVDLGLFFFEASSIQKMGHRYILEIPIAMTGQVRAMTPELRKGKWKVQAEAVR